VCNAGTEPGNTFAHLVLSQDRNIQLPFNQPYPEDMPLAPVPVGQLYPGQCVTKQVQAHANVPQEGLWYLGAAIEVSSNSYPQELRTDNNARASDSPMGVGNGPDYVVKSVSGPANVQPGQPFTASVTVCNEGTDSGNTFAHLLLSADRNIQLPFNQPYPEDVPLAPVDVGHLSPGQCVTKQVQASANVPQEGVWYLGAAIEVPSYGQQELRTDNNARASDSPMGVGYKPDYAVKAVSGPAGVQPGQSFTASVTVCNEGTDSGNTFAHLVLSRDTNIQLPFNQPYPEDMPLAPVDVGHLYPGQCVTKQVQAHANVPQEGLWYLGAAIEVPPYGQQELRTDNNALASQSPMGIGFYPDFVVKAVSGPANVRPGDSFPVSVKVCNEGTEPGTPYAHLVLSADTNIESPINQPYVVDYPLGMVPVGELSPGQCVTQQVQAHAETWHEGVWYLGAVIESNSSYPQELRTDNNTRASDSPLGIGNLPDYVVKAVSGPANVQQGQSFTAAVTVCNAGTEPGNTFAHLVLSADRNIQLPFNQPYPEDMLLAPVPVGQLYPGQCVTKQVQAHANVPQNGVWYLGAAIEVSSTSYPQELRTDNNARASDSPMGVGNGPDYVVKSVKGPASVKPGDPFTTLVTVCNEGTDSGSTHAHLVLSQDRNIRLPFNQPYPEDVPLAPVNVGPLYPGQCVTKQVQANANVPQEGVWYLGAAIEVPSYGPQELRTDNNARASDEPVGVGYKPDYVVQSVSGPASVKPGDPLMVTVKLCNQGTEPGMPNAHLLLSEDTNIQLPFNQPYPPEDMPLAPVNVGPLSPGQCGTKQLSVSAQAPHDGAWYLGVVIDAPPSSSNELRTDNNTRASDEPVGIGFAPDFVVQSVSGPSSVMLGGSLTATVKLCNQGTQSGTPNAHLLFSRDTLIELPFNQPYVVDSPLAPVNVGPLSPGQCVTRQVNTSAHAPQDGDWYLGVAIEANSYGPVELNPRNNSKAGNVVATHY
jgi:hypothetical protein